MWVALIVSIGVLLGLRMAAPFDVFFSNLFFREVQCVEGSDREICGYFPLTYQPFWIFVREVGHALPRILMLAVVIHFIWILVFNNSKTLAQMYPPLIAIFTALLGPIFIVNVVLKENWGRPRPWQTTSFGGEHPFVLPGDITSYCDTNCSFVSGEASAAFWMLILCLYFTGRKRINVAVFTMIIALGIAFLRVVFGRHYLSDVVMAGMINWFVFAFVIWLVQVPLVQVWIAGWHCFSNSHAIGRKGKKI
ncbi:MAG: phosphatase PAP2 family protein [Rhizobiaceae bacterium]